MNSFVNLAPGVYNLEVRDVHGCTFDTTFVINEGNQFNLTTLSPLELVFNQQQILSIITDLDSNEIASVVWTPSENLSCDTCLVTTLTAKKK
ncbi:MAG: hypothetical protein IPO92_18325 [Saprospiraceae bacterium]|nr:hypothetical protein [Saprospiraceae bacterium]